MKLHGSEGVLLMEVESIKADGRRILVKGKMMGQIPMQVVLGPQEIREIWKMSSLSLWWKALGMLLFGRKSG